MSAITAAWRQSGTGLKIALAFAVLAAIASVLIVLGIVIDAGPAVSAVGATTAAITGIGLAVIGFKAIPRGLMTYTEIGVAAILGGLVATCFASLFNSIGPGVVVAPFVEEVLKLVGVIVVLFMFGVGSPIRGFSVGFVVGASFEVYENFLYLASPDDRYTAVSEAWAAVPIRILLGFGLHAATTALTGAAVAYSLVYTGKVLGRVSAGALALAITLHLVWDLATVAGPVGYALMAVDYAALVAVFFAARKRALAASSAPLESAGFGNGSAPVDRR